MGNKLHSILHFVKHYLQANRSGHGIHSPFAYSLCEEVFYNKDAFYDFEFLAQLRSKLAQDQTTLRINDLGAGSRKMNSRERSISEILNNGTSKRRQSELLYKLVNYLRLEKCIELGTSVGLNTLYLAAAAGSGSVYTIEGDEGLSNYARNLAHENDYLNIRHISGNFDEEFPKLIQELQGFDLLYIDGNHLYEPTMRYFELALQHSHPNSVIVLDDIYWSRQMTKAWREISSRKEVKLSIDLFQMGLVFFRTEMKEKVSLRMLV